MQNPSTIPTNNQPRIVGAVTHEISDALRSLKASEFAFEAEYYHLDWERRAELADDLRVTLDELDDPQADVIALLAEDLESEAEDFSTWDARSDAARRVRLVIRSLEKEAANA